jgi:signal transduction histidine kinase
LIIVLIAVIAISDHPHELTSGRSLIFWFLPIVLSVIVLPAASVFIVDIVVFVLFALFGRSWESLNIYALFVIGLTSLMAWLGMSIAQRALRDARNEAEKNRAILNGVADGVVVLNANDQVVLANPAALHMLGSAIARFASTANEDRKEVGGRVLSFNWRDVKDVGNVAIVRDISRQVEVERAKDAILGVVSHEMRTPLAAILGFSEVLARTSSSPEIAERIHVNAQRMIALVDDLLDHAQIQAGTLKMSRERFSPITLANTVRDLLAARAAEKGVALNIAVSDALPPNLLGDPQRLQQIFINLTWNAIKFTDPGGRVDVLLSPNSDDANAWSMVVSDTGIGIPPERLPDIYEPFRRASDYATRTHQGAGLGLSIAKKIARLMGGDIEVTSMVGQGSVFTVTLPLEIAE